MYIVVYNPVYMYIVVFNHVNMYIVVFNPVYMYIVLFIPVYMYIVGFRINLQLTDHRTLLETIVMTCTGSLNC